MKVICEYCNKEFEKPFKYVNQQKKRYFHTFCSRECSAKSRRNRIKVNCDQCGKELLLTPYDITKTKGGKNYCSKTVCKYRKTKKL